MHVLIVETGKHKGKRLKLPDGETVVGRDSDAQVRIASNEVSRRHCVLTGAGTRLSVRDLGSSNGTFVNGAPILGDHELQPGDRLVIGPMGFQFEGPAPGVAQAAASARKASSDNSDLSDDEIALMLSDSNGDTVSQEDTAVITYGGAPASAGQQAPIKPVKKKAFRSVAEEGADIIRRHQEGLAAQSEDAGE